MAPFSTIDNHGGRVVIIRDHHGVPIAGGSYFFSYVCDLERAELLACHRAVL
jgi:hypothetical protein